MDEIDWSQVQFRYMRWRQSMRSPLWRVDQAWYFLLGALSGVEVSC